MYRYFFLIWDPRSLQAAATARLLSERIVSVASGWARAFEANGVVAFHAGLVESAGGPLRLGQGGGAVFGRIFHNDMEDAAAAVRVVFDSDESVRVLQSGGRRLIDKYWGRYVALVHDPASSETWVLRDPSGGLPCLMTSHQGVNLVFSDLEDCLGFGIGHFTINWAFIRRLVGFSAIQVRETGLNEVSEIQSGERVRFSGNSIHRSIEWNPLAIAQTDTIQDPGTAVAELRRTVRSCVHVWASCYTDILHNLSGGLDSSIVLSCLKDAPSRPNITCLNYFGGGPDEDERKYARAMAQLAKVELVEHRLDVREARLQDIQRLRRSARPWFYFYELEHGEFEAQLALERQAGGLFSGSGGDGVFFQTRADLAVTDYLFDHGLGSGLLGVAVDAARISRASVWPLLFKALRARVSPRSWRPLDVAPTVTRTLVSQDIQRSVSRDPAILHPWFADRSLRGIPPGTLWHIMSVAVAPAFYSSLEGGPNPERVLPLLSQPLVELCLRTPTYVLIRNGMDRATARRAFAGDIPPEIAKRRSKGRIDQHVRNVLDANLDFVRDLLLNGRLVREGLLDRQSLELYLTRERSPADHQYAEILHEHLCTEAWLGRWLDVRSAAAATDNVDGPLSHQVLRT